MFGSVVNVPLRSSVISKVVFLSMIAPTFLGPPWLSLDIYLWVALHGLSRLSNLLTLVCFFGFYSLGFGPFQDDTGELSDGP